MAKQQNTAPSIAEFEDWDEIREAEALAEVANQVKVRHIIKNNEYWALTPGGTVYKLPPLSFHRRLRGPVEHTDRHGKPRTGQTHPHRFRRRRAGRTTRTRTHAGRVQPHPGLRGDARQITGRRTGKIADFCRILNSDDGVKVRADFARFGWSIEHDLGRRLPYRDAIDLYTALCGDPSSYTGASLIGLMFPMSATDITVLQFLGASTLLGDVDGEPETDEPTAEEIHEAETHMSKLFG